MDPIAQLPQLSWRGLPSVPCDDASFEVRHSQSERRWPYKDAAGHDWTGRDPVTITAQLYFIDTVQSGAFSTLWNRYREAFLEDGKPGDLVHPLLGTMRAVPITASVKVVAQVRSGVIAQFSWTETVEDPDVTATFFETIQIDPAAAAKAADAAIEEFDIEYPDGTGDTSCLEAYESIKGQIGSTVTQVTGKINQVMGTVEGLIDDVDSLDDPEAWPAHDNLIAFWSSLSNLKDEVKNASKRQTATRTTTAETTIEKFASQVGNSVDDIMNLNPSALRSPSISKGTTLTYYT